MEEVFAIVGARLFDGTRPLAATVLVIEGEHIAAVRDEVPYGVRQIDGSGGTVLPGLIDAHTHTDEAGLRAALSFGVTTELDLMSVPERMMPLRSLARHDLSMADVRSSSWALTDPDGHPHQLRTGLDDPPWPTVAAPANAQTFVDDRVAEGADYIKVLVEDGAIFGTTMPTVSPEVLTAVVEASHRRGLLVLVHALSAWATRIAVDAGADGLAHLMCDEVIADDLVATMAAADMFVIPTMTTIGSAASDGAGPLLAEDLRVASRLDNSWIENLEGQFDLVADLGKATESVGRLHRAGVEILAGTDAAHLGAPGLAHGASLHDELRLLAAAGLSRAEVLCAATRRTANRFGLSDRGRLEPGALADLVLVDGDPLLALSATLNTRAVWRRGCRLRGRETPAWRSGDRAAHEAG